MSIAKLFFISIIIATLCFSCKNEKDAKLIVELPDQDSEVIVTEDSQELESVSPKVMTEATLDLTEYGIANSSKNVLGGLKVGDDAPDFSLYDHRGNVVNLDQKLNLGPIVLVFYRADWCPYCTKHLAEFKDGLRDILANGHATIIAVSPQRKEFTAKLVKENKIVFPVLHDAGHTVMKKYRVFYHVTDAYNDKVKKHFGQSIEEMNGNKKPFLPVPATYIIGQDLKIKYVHYDPDYSKRADIQDVIDNLQ